MKKRLIIIALAAAVAASGCQQPAANNAAANSAPVNTAPANSNVNNGTPADMNVAGSPTAVYKTAFELRKKKDIQGLKKVMSKDVLAFLTDMGSADKKSLDEVLMEMTNEPMTTMPEVRNETITGDRATLEYKDPDGTWKMIDFIKENGEWKLTLPEVEKDGPEPAAKP